MSKIEDINKLLPDNDSRAIEPRHIREAFGKVMENTKEQIQQIAVLKPLGPEIYFDEDSIDLSGGQLLYSFDNYRYTAISFEDFMKGVNKNLKVNNNATGDDTYTYEVVAKPDKTLGIVRKKFVDVLIENVDIGIGREGSLGYYYTIMIENWIKKILDVELIVTKGFVDFTIKPEMIVYCDGALTMYIPEKVKSILSAQYKTVILKYRKIVY